MFDYKKNKRDYNFFPKKHHRPVERYGLMAKALKKMPKVTKEGIYTLATISRENIGIDSQYQRAS